MTVARQEIALPPALVCKPRSAPLRFWPSSNWSIPTALSVLGLLVHHQWLTSLPLAAGDWQWMPAEQLRTWFPSATVWWPEMGFGLKNFGGIYELPVEAVAGLFA